MAGRPKKEDSRDNQYRVRLNDAENEMLDYVSRMTEKKKSDVFRQALTELYEKTKYAEAVLEFGVPVDDEMEYMDPDGDDFGISLKRVINCPYCGHGNKVDFAEDCNTCSEERSMGPEITYYFDWDEYACEQCDRPFSIKGYICEYPVNCYNFEEIDVEEIDDEEGE